MPTLHHDPHPVDLHVGARIRLRRRELKISQTELAEGLGITFQQVQKYERGANRISASKLYDTAKVLGVPFAWFAAELPDPVDGGGDPPDPVFTQFMASRDGPALARAVNVLRPDQAAALARLADAMAETALPAAVRRLA